MFLCEYIRLRVSIRRRNRQGAAWRDLRRARLGRRPLQQQRRVVCAGVLKFRVYANGNYWTAKGWEDDAVSDFDEGTCGRVEGRAGDARRHGEGAGAAVAGFGEAV